MGALLGINAKLYRQTTGTRAAWPATGAPANLEAVGNVRDLTLSVTEAEADVSTRGNGGWRATIGALKDASLSFGMVWDPEDTHFAAIRDAFMDRTSIPLAVLDQLSTVEGAQGLWADWRVVGFEKTENLEDAQRVTVTLKPAYSTVAPEWVEVTLS